MFQGNNYSPSGGSIDRTATPSRQIQFVLKLLFRYRVVPQNDNWTLNNEHFSLKNCQCSMFICGLNERSIPEAFKKLLPRKNPDTLDSARPLFKTHDNIVLEESFFLQCSNTTQVTLTDRILGLDSNTGRPARPKPTPEMDVEPQ